jgi:hypothetical protein
MSPDRSVPDSPAPVHWRSRQAVGAQKWEVAFPGAGRP